MLGTNLGTRYDNDDICSFVFKRGLLFLKQMPPFDKTMPLMFYQRFLFSLWVYISFIASSIKKGLKFFLLFFNNFSLENKLRWRCIKMPFFYFCLIKINGTLSWSFWWPVLFGKVPTCKRRNKISVLQKDTLSLLTPILLCTSSAILLFHKPILELKNKKKKNNFTILVKCQKLRKCRL